MKVTKLGHSCLLVEMPEPVNRTALFDPGIFSSVDVGNLEYLDDIFITHIHPDHCDIELIKKLVEKFPQVRITATSEIVTQLAEAGMTASNTPPQNVEFFDSPHEVIRPFYPHDPPQEIGVHYLDLLSHPGDSHSFRETKAVLALPVQAPWGSPNDAVKLGIALRPQYIIPIHDWHWSDPARETLYDAMEKAFSEAGITFLKPVNGVAFDLDT